MLLCYPGIVVQQPWNLISAFLNESFFHFHIVHLSGHRFFIFNIRSTWVRRLILECKYCNLASVLISIGHMSSLFICNPFRYQCSDWMIFALQVKVQGRSDLQTAIEVLLVRTVYICICPRCIIQNYTTVQHIIQSLLSFSNR